MLSTTYAVSSVAPDVAKVQAWPSYTGVLPSWYQAKWFVWEIISQIFNSAGYIGSAYIDAFREIFSINNNVPVWNQATKQFNESSIYNVSGGNVWIGTATPASLFHAVGTVRADGGIRIDSSPAISSTNRQHTAQSVWDPDYGIFAVKNNSGDLWAYFGAGNGGNRVNLVLATADRINIEWGSVGIEEGNPQQALDVNGKIRMQNQTVSTDADDTVATKKYVDDSVWGGIFTLNVLQAYAQGNNVFVASPATYPSSATVSRSLYSVCFLTTVDHYNLNGAGTQWWGWCILNQTTTSWILTARPERRAGIICRASCLQ